MRSVHGTSRMKKKTNKPEEEQMAFDYKKEYMEAALKKYESIT